MTSGERVSTNGPTLEVTHLDDNSFTYQGWSFSRQEDGSLMVQQPSLALGPFGKTEQQIQEPITIPSDQVQRLISYVLSGDPDNTNVLTKINTLTKEYVTA